MTSTRINISPIPSSPHHDPKATLALSTMVKVLENRAVNLELLPGSKKQQDGASQEDKYINPSRDNIQIMLTKAVGNSNLRRQRRKTTHQPAT
jgi:hypothetical protein